VTIDDYGQPVKTSDLVVVGDPALNGPTASATQFAANLANHHDMVANCMATQMFRYMAKRNDPTNAGDLAAITSLQSSFTGSQESVTALLTALTQADAFLYRMNVQ
jgi:Protein of unknown function (DUF1585)